MKKFIAALLTGTIVFSSMSYSAFAEDYLTRGEACGIILQAADDYNPDVEKDDVMHGDGAGSLFEDREITKLEAFIMMNRAFGDYPELKGNSKIMNISDAEYDDIPEWAQSDMEQSLAAGIADSSDGSSFGSDEKVTKTDLEKYLKRVYALFGTNLKDSFYYTANKDKLDNIKIGTGRSSGGTIYDVMDKADEQVQEIVNECVNGTFEKGSKEEKIKNYYSNYVDVDARNALTVDGLVGEYLDDIENIETIDDFQIFNKKMYDELGVALIYFDLAIDDMDSNQYILTLSYPYADLSKEAYIGKNDNEKNAYINYLTKILTLYGESKEQADADVQQYFETQTKIGEKELDIADMYDIEKTYNIYTVEQLDEIFGEIDIDKLYKESELDHLDKICIYEPDTMEESAKLLTAERIGDLKNYCKMTMITFAADFLGQDYIDASNEYDRESKGIDESKPIEKQAADDICSTFSEYIGEIYCDKYCTDEIIADVTQIAEQIVDIYSERIDNLDWMSDETKTNAKHKLETMKINIGEPAEFKDYYADADIKSKEEGGSYFQNTIELYKQIVRMKIEISKEPVDKSEWPMSPQTVNACYYPYANSIYVPIAFLQDPIYDINDSYEEKLGKIGDVLGHEISHAFDSSGAQYDEYGNAANWWTDEDTAEFERLCDNIIEYYDKSEWCPGIPVDGELTLTENIADLGGLSVALSLAAKTENFDYDKFFKAYALFYTRTYTRESSKNYSQTDPHSPHSIRVNNTVQNMKEFYETYDVQEGDGMYVSEEDRIGIW